MKIHSLIIIFVAMAESVYSQSVPLVINTWPWKNPTAKAWKVLKESGSALDAVVEGCSVAEEEVDIFTVGWGGSPDESGDTALDALIMDGATHDVGAVGSMKRIKPAIRVASHVLKNTQHSLIVGEDATQFAVQMGFKEEDLKSKNSIAQWENWKNNSCQPNFWKNVSPNPKTSCGPYKPIRKQDSGESSDVNKFDINNHDTIGMITIDSNGNIVSGTSSNGATFKVKGRVGDSPIPGSGAYVDNDVGAAVATGDGDVMMRFLPSYQAVENMRSGMSPSQAAEDAIRRILKYYNKFEGALVVANKTGAYGAACYGWKFRYSVVNQQLGDVTIKEVLPFQ